MLHQPDVAQDQAGRFLRSGLAAPLLAAALGCLAVMLRWRGVDLPAHLYRVDLFRRDGFTMWDSQWYAGHWNLSYTLLFPPVAGVLGVQVTEVLSAGAAAWAFDRLVVSHFGIRARVGSLVFAVWTLAQVAIGQLPFLMGEALALCALVAALRGRRLLAGALAVACALASPLAGGFLMIAVAAWLLTAVPRRRVSLVLLLAAPAATLLTLFLLFPGQGAMPFAALKCLLVAGLAGAAYILIPPRERALRVGVLLYGLTVLVAFAVASPVGDNITRLAACVGVPLLVCLASPLRRWLILGILVPLALLQWIPTLDSIFSNGRSPAVHATYYRPLVDYLQAHSQPASRVEVVPTRLHWEATYVAPTVPLARGWERQLDTANNPIFYEKDRLTPTSYLAWLRTNGVRYVALPDVQVDYAAAAEADLVRAGVAGLSPVWHDAHWRVYEVSAATGIVQGPARLRSIEGGQVALDVTAPGTVTLRVRYSRHWVLAEGDGCLVRTPEGWTKVVARRAGPIKLRVNLVASSRAAC
ncbi:MAG: putative integral rane protein [Acidimicrobiales bacterium]|nr:putative integral rane protein [Acidimicrobiales bacterium]